jgi:hypothetical protein
LVVHALCVGSRSSTTRHSTTKYVTIYGATRKTKDGPCCWSKTKSKGWTVLLSRMNSKGCAIQWNKTITLSLLHKMVHPLMCRCALQNAPCLAVFLCVITFSILRVWSSKQHQTNNKVFNKFWSNTKTQRMDHFMKQNENKRKGWIILWSRTRTQRMDHFMKQNEKAKDGPFYEAEWERKGWTILWSKTKTQRMDNCMKQNHIAKFAS